MKLGTTITCLVILTAIAGCGGTKVYHRVQSGETLYKIGRSYGVSVASIIAANDIDNGSRLEVGQRLLIPGADEEVALSRSPKPAAEDSESGRSDLALAWPIGGGVVTSSFGERNGSHHDGIDVSAPAGTAVLAAQDGEVLFSDVLRGYGNLVIVRHRGGYSTVYAHNQVNLVREGQRVRRGNMIARVGTTGHAQGSNLHFEVRKDNVARNPLPFLPASEQIALQSNQRGS